MFCYYSIYVEILNECKQSILSYIRFFGSKPVCFRDIQLYLPKVPIEITKEICTSVEQTVKQEFQDSEVKF